jgi:hypothetical protein
LIPPDQLICPFCVAAVETTGHLLLYSSAFMLGNFGPGFFNGGSFVVLSSDYRSSAIPMEKLWLKEKHRSYFQHG